MEGHCLPRGPQDKVILTLNVFVLVKTVMRSHARMTQVGQVLVGLSKFGLLSMPLITSINQPAYDELKSAKFSLPFETFRWAARSSSSSLG